MIGLCCHAVKDSFANDIYNRRNPCLLGKLLIIMSCLSIRYLREWTLIINGICKGDFKIWFSNTETTKTTCPHPCVPKPSFSTTNNPQSDGGADARAKKEQACIYIVSKIAIHSCGCFEQVYILLQTPQLWGLGSELTVIRSSMTQKECLTRVKDKIDPILCGVQQSWGGSLMQELLSVMRRLRVPVFPGFPHGLAWPKATPT